MTTTRFRAGAVAVLASLALAAAAAPASAAPRAAKGPAFALANAYAGGAVRLRAAPGGTARGAVRVRNLSSHRVTVLLRRADIRNATNGNADYITTHPARAGRWLHLSAKVIRLAPWTSRRVAFTVLVPRRARGASHYAGIVAVDASEVAAATAPRTRKGSKGAGFTIARINRQALPLTIRLPGPLTRRLTVRTVKLDVQPAGAGLLLGLLPSGTVLIQGADVRLRVSRGRRTILSNVSTLGQLFPGSRVNYRIAWNGRPTRGAYRVRGFIRPKGAPTVYINQTVTFTPAKAQELGREAPPVLERAAATATATPSWVPLALAGGVSVLVALLLIIWRLARRRPTAPAA